MEAYALVSRTDMAAAAAAAAAPAAPPMATAVAAAVQPSRGTPAGGGAWTLTPAPGRRAAAAAAETPIRQPQLRTPAAGARVHPKYNQIIAKSVCVSTNCTAPRCQRRAFRRLRSGGTWRCELGVAANTPVRHPQLRTPDAGARPPRLVESSCWHVWYSKGCAC